jgi:LuxR family maltose regulon positive regulatory protein
VELDHQLLDAKISAPQPRGGTVSRADLIEAARASGRRLVSVTAPAGYGKTSLLAEWAATDPRRVAWTSLDRLDDDPAALLMLLATAFVVATGQDAGLVADMAGLGSAVLARGAPRMASALRTSPEPFLIVLDDLHEVRAPICHDVLSVVIAGVPDGSQLAFASRVEEPFVPRLRATGEAVEITARDLALDELGAQRIFAASHVAASPEQVAVVTRRTEGWPVGIYLASLVARDGGAGDAMVTGDDRYVADYLQREALMQMPEDLRRFLRRTSVLDHLTAPLCDAVVAEPGGRGAQEMLRDLEASSMFVVPLDRRREWFRYHALFREFLLGELALAEPDLAMKLHLRAADWYESHGSPVRALEHLLNTTERERCVHLVTQLGMATYQAGQMSTMLRWLRSLGESAITNYPPLAILAGYIAALSGQAVEAERWAAAIETLHWDLVPLDGTASFVSARAVFRGLMCASGPARMMADTDAGVRAEPAWSPWRDNALVLHGEACLLVGDVEAATRFFSEGIETAVGNGNVDTVLLAESELAVLDMHHGHWSQAGERLQRALTIVDEHRMHDNALSVLAFAAAARLHLHLGQGVEAARQLTKAMRARPICTYAMPYLAVRTRVHLAWACAGGGDHGAARHLLREIDDVLLHRPDLGTLLAEVATLRAALASNEHVAETGASPLTPAELRLLPYLQTHLTIREIGDRLFISRNTASSEIGSIYRKLGASSRSGAVERAVAMGLLGH